VLLAQLSIRDRARVLLAGSSGLRRSEMFALTWADVNAITLESERASLVCSQPLRERQESRKPVPLHPLVLEALLKWKRQSLYRSETDSLFASLRLNGTKPLGPDNLLKRYIRPAVKRAGIEGKTIGWHNFHHSQPAGDGGRREGGARTTAARKTSGRRSISTLARSRSRSETPTQRSWK
jgi:integrase